MTENTKSIARKDRILNAALKIFAEKGFQNATIVEISKEARVSEATIYDYFGTKEELLFIIPERISDESHQKMEKILPFIKGVEGRIRAILQGYVQLYQSNPHYSALMLLQLTANKRFRKTAAHAAVRRSAHTLLDCIREGIADGTFKKDSNAYLIRSMLLGTIEHLFIHWHMQGMPERHARIMDMLDPFVETVFEGIRAKKEETGITLHLKLEDAQDIKEFLTEQGILEEDLPVGSKFDDGSREAD
jgi:AcrR family transcriptional regulator